MHLKMELIQLWHSFFGHPVAVKFAIGRRYEVGERGDHYCGLCLDISPRQTFQRKRRKGIV